MEDKTKLQVYAGMLEVRAVNDIMIAMAEQPDPAPLYDQIWSEGELACLFADSNVGKSILAVQIAQTIAQAQPVLYVDCELSDKQFQLRYTNQDTGEFQKFPSGFYRATVSPERIGERDFETALLNDIEKAAIKVKSTVIIVDNLTFACNNSEKGDAAGAFMMRIKQLQMKYGWSLLIIAHTPKRETGMPITANHLAGSKKLFNFFDTVFAIGKSEEDSNYRYLIQLKVRSGEFVYDKDSVAVFDLQKCDDGTLYFKFVKRDTETNQLTNCGLEEFEVVEDIVKKHNDGMTYRQIAEELGMSKSRVQRIYKKSAGKTRFSADTSGFESSLDSAIEESEMLFDTM